MNFKKLEYYRPDKHRTKVRHVTRNILNYYIAKEKIERLKLTFVLRQKYDL